MPIDPTDLANLQAASLSGRPPCAEYLKVTWDTGVVNYYGTAAWQDEPPFEGIGFTIEPRIIPKSRRDPFHGMEINPDLRTDTIKILFDDIDKDIRTKLQTYGSGVKCEFFLYYPDQNDTHYSPWDGRLQAPDIYGSKTTEVIATNGHKSRELSLPRRQRPRECLFTFGGSLPDAESIRSNGCPYDLHIGGSIGKFKTGSTPFTDCPKDRASCVARIDENSDGLPEFFGGFDTDVSPVVTDHQNFYLAKSKGHASIRTEPIRWIFGTKNVRSLPKLFTRPEVNAPNPAFGFFSMLVEIGEGPVAAMYNLKVNNQFVGQEHINFRLGGRGQVRTGYAPDVSNLSSLAHIFLRYGWVNAAQSHPNHFDVECMVQGFSEVCVYTDDDPVTKTRVYSNDRVWCLLECYKNQKAGFGYAESEIAIADWMTTSTWGTRTASFTATYGDGESITYIGQQTTFNAILEGRPVHEQIEDICRAGSIAVPFWHEGKLTTTAIRAFTEDELDDAPIFYDKGQNVNICWEDGEPMVQLSQIPDDKLTNDVKIPFEEASNNGIERTITIDDRNQKLKAGRQLGAEYFFEVPKTYSGFGIDNLAEAARMGYRLLKYGPFDEGGTDNNLGLKITVPFEQSLGLRRYGPMKLVSEILDPFLLAPGTDVEETPEWFRVIRLKRVSGNRMEITAQAYNRTSYEAFETESVVTPTSGPVDVYGAGDPVVDGLYEYVGQVNNKPAYESGARNLLNDGSKWVLTVEGSQFYRSSNNTAFPWTATWIVGTFGTAPEPTVSQHVHIDGGGCKVTLGVPSYDPLTGLIDIPIDPC